MIQEYVDDNPREVLYFNLISQFQEFTCCEWVIIQSETDNLKEMYIAVGGTQSLIKILDCMNQVVSNVRNLILITKRYLQGMQEQFKEFDQFIRII